jgi:hypothetical protein
LQSTPRRLINCYGNVTLLDWIWGHKFGPQAQLLPFLFIGKSALLSNNCHIELFLNRFALLFLLIPLSTAAEDTFISAAETLAFGLFTSSERNMTTTGARKNAPPADSVEKYWFQEFTNKVPMTLGTEFGIEYRVNTQPIGRPIDITTIIYFPEPGLVRPKGRTYKKSTETKRVSIGEPQLHGYGFDEQWELVAGEWVFEVWHKKSRLVRRSFFVYDPDVQQADTE